ncbi:hypothetical protein P9112_011198 [Eukaryota sp. TZLM1-RC]
MLDSIPDRSGIKKKYSLALSSEGKLYGWGCNVFKQINIFNSHSLRITPINIPYNIKEVYGGNSCSFALTQEGQVIQWGDHLPFEFIEGLNNIVDHTSFIGMDRCGDFFYWNLNRSTKIPVKHHLFSKERCKGSFSFDRNNLVLKDSNGDVWVVESEDSFNNKPIKIKGLTNIVHVAGSERFCVAFNSFGNVFVYRNYEPLCIEPLTNMEGISVGRDFLFAYNKNTVWSWGMKDKGQLGTGDLIDRPQPVKVFGSKILDSFHYPKQPVDRMFISNVHLQSSKRVFCVNPTQCSRQ